MQREPLRIEPYSQQHSPLKRRELTHADEPSKLASNMSDARGLEYKNFESIHSSKLVTLSPQRQGELRDEAKPRILESQPRQNLGEPLQSNLETLKRQRYGRPNTNSPFPYMQKRNVKGKQLPLPSTAATSNLNNLFAINEDQSPVNQLGDVNQTISSPQQHTEANADYYQAQKKQIEADNFSKLYSSSNGASDLNINIMDSLQSSSNFLSSFKEPFPNQYQGHSNQDYTQHPTLRDQLQLKHQQIHQLQEMNASFRGQEVSNKQYANNESQVSNQQINEARVQRLRKRKVFTEPNSPKHTMNEQAQISNALIQNSARSKIVSGQQMIIGREMPIRQSIEKFNNMSKAQGNQIQLTQRQRKREAQVHLDHAQKSGTYTEDQASTYEYLNNSNVRHNSQDVSGYFTEDKNQSFLPRLDISHRYNNSQVQYRDSLELQRGDASFMSDGYNKSPVLNGNLENYHTSYKKSSFSQDRKGNQQFNSNSKAQDFAKIYKGSQISHNAKHTKPTKLNFNSAALNASQIDSQNMREFSELFSLKNGIGKYQPVTEIKTQFNEQLIRGKIYRDNKISSETPQKIDNLNLTKSSFSEVTSPKNIYGSPVGIMFEQNKPVRVDPRKKPNNGISYKNSLIYSEAQSNMRLINASDLSYQDQDINNSQIIPGSQFNHRNYSMSQGTSKPDLKHNFTSPVPQFSTIEDVIIQSRDPLVKPSSGATAQSDNLQKRYQKAYYDMPDLPESKQESRIPSFDKTTDSTQLKQAHHAIKTLASKQMPKCFRMSKQQVDLINRHNIKGANTSTHQSNKILQLDAHPKQFEYTFVASKQIAAPSQRSISNDARMSFNDNSSHPFSTIQKSKADILLNSERRSSKRQSSEYHHNQNGSVDSNLFANDISNMNVKVDVHVEVDRERMTPAFNARQSYIKANNSNTKP